MRMMNENGLLRDTVLINLKKNINGTILGCQPPKEQNSHFKVDLITVKRALYTGLQD